MLRFPHYPAYISSLNEKPKLPAERTLPNPPPQEPPLLPHKVKSVRLLVSTRRPQPEEKESSEDLPMAVDEEPEVSATITAFLLLNF